MTFIYELEPYVFSPENIYGVVALISSYFTKFGIFDVCEEWLNERR